MDSSQDVVTNNQLPRGLITRRGTQRLPSLRSDSHSSQSFLTPNVSNNSLANNTTKGGVLKRTFKPTIPVRRSVNGEEDNETSKRIRNTDNSHSGRKGKQPKSRTKLNDSKNWVQTEGAVFKGESVPNLRSSRIKEESTTRHRSSNVEDLRIKNEKSDESSSKVKIENKFENKAKTIRRLYGDNFVDDDDLRTDKHIVYPKGWQTVSSHRQSTPSNSVPLNPFNLLKAETQEKMLLMQIPEMILKRSDGYIGKMRVYKSGRIELIDSESDVKFDILFDRNSNFEENVKQENDSKYSQTSAQSSFEDFTQDVVSFNGTDLCTLTTLDHKQVLMAVPSIPLDNRITNLFL